MATVNVNSWAQFVEAVQVSGDTVVCPQGAVWDFNELYPDGISSAVSVQAAEIKGNGTTIKNAHSSGVLLSFEYNATTKLDALHIENFACESGSLLLSTSASNGQRFEVTGCRFSGILPANCNYFCGGSYKYPNFTSCSFALDCATSGQFFLGFANNYGNGSAKYCRIRVQLPNAGTGYSGFFQRNCTWCKIDVDQPGADSLWVDGAAANVYGGDMPNVTAYIGSHSAAYISLINSDEIPHLAGVSGYTAAVTSDQLHDAAYLAGIGFPIGV